MNKLCRVSVREDSPTRPSDSNYMADGKTVPAYAVHEYVASEVKALMEKKRKPDEGLPYVNVRIWPAEDLADGFIVQKESA